jgi:hypothetical protein
MKHIALAATAALGFVSIAAPAQAALFSWSVEYTGWWEEQGGGSIAGSFVASEADAADGIVALDEISAWMWDWSGNDYVSAFSISSKDKGSEIQILGDPNGFYGDGTPNLPGLADGLDQGTFVGGDAGEYVLDLEYLGVEDNTVSFPFGGAVVYGDVAAAGSITVSEPIPVPEPASLIGLLAIAGGIGGSVIKRQKQVA